MPAATAANGWEGSRVELDQRRDHVVKGQDPRAKQTFACAARWPESGHQWAA